MTPIRLVAAALSAAVLAGATPAFAESFTLLVFENPASFAKRTDPAAAPAYWGAYATAGKAMGEAGVLRGGSPLEAADRGEVVGAPGSASTDGLILGGWFQIDVASLDEAVRWAGTLPAAKDGRVDIRRAAAAPGM